MQAYFALQERQGKRHSRSLPFPAILPLLRSRHAKGMIGWYAHCVALHMSYVPVAADRPRHMRFLQEQCVGALGRSLPVLSRKE